MDDMRELMRKNRYSNRSEKCNGESPHNTFILGITKKYPIFYSVIS